MKSEPFALQIYRRFLDGETISALATELGIPPERVELRIRAAAIYYRAESRRAVPEDWQFWA